MRHNNVRDVEAEFLDEVCRGVETEPGLLPVEPENFEALRRELSQKISHA